jgi:hypothetical protein
LEKKRSISTGLNTAKEYSDLQMEKYSRDVEEEAEKWRGKLKFCNPQIKIE